MAQPICSGLGFEFENRPKWREWKDSRKKLSTDAMIDDMVMFRKLYRDLPDEEKKFCHDSFAPVMTVDFIYHLNTGEWITSQTKTGREDVLASVLDMTTPESSMSDYDTKKTKTKATLNTIKAMTMLQSIFKQEVKGKGLLTLQHICDVHEVLMKDLQPGAGKLRKTEAYTIWNGCPHFYPSPSRLEDILHSVIDCYNIYVSSLPPDHSKEEVEYVFKCAARFLFDFVDVHPFANGNGRMCRLLANYILTLITPFPVGICHSETRREDYINAVVECRENPAEGPRNIAAMLVEGAWKGWMSLFQNLASRKHSLSAVLVGPIVVQVSKLGDIYKSVDRVLEGKNILTVKKEDVIKYIGEALTEEITANLQRHEHREHTVEIAPYLKFDLKIFK